MKTYQIIQTVKNWNGVKHIKEIMPLSYNNYIYLFLKSETNLYQNSRYIWILILNLKIKTIFNLQNKNKMKYSRILIFMYSEYKNI